MSRILDLMLSALMLPVAALPRRYRRRYLQRFIEREELRGTDDEALRFLLQAESDTRRAIDRAAKRYGGGEHPKHRLTDYHAFFINNIRPGERVLDVGCGAGELAADIASNAPDCTVTGIDMEPARIAEAEKRHAQPNMRFVVGDACMNLPDGRYDVAVLSNVLEHLDGRVDFLRDLIARSRAKRVLVRVPLFERDWTVPLRKELGVDYLSDPQHKTEHTRKDIQAELEKAGLNIVSMECAWGEAWIVATPDAGGAS